MINSRKPTAITIELLEKIRHQYRLHWLGTHGVIRTSGEQDGSSYVALGVNLDELTRDNADTSYSWGDSDLSFGFGVNNSSFKIEYMMHVNEENYDISAISLGYTSAF